MTETDGLPIPRRYWSMVTIGIVVGMTVLDASIANVALPTIARDLNTSPANSIWVVNAYQIAIVTFLLPLASLGEIVGYRKVYQAGAVLFTLASLACALSHDLPMLTAARVVQGLGASAIMSMNSAMVRFTYPSDRLGQGIGINAVLVALISAAAPTVASGILAIAPWPWLFAINVPLGVISIVVGQSALPHIPGSQRRFDWLAGALATLTLSPLIMGLAGLTEGGNRVLSILSVILGLAAGTLMVVRSLSQPRPLFPIDLLRIPILAMSTATSISGFLAQNFSFVALPFLIEYAFGRSPVETGLLMTPWSLAVAAAGMFSARLADRSSGAVVAAAGLVILGLGIVLLALLPAHPSNFDLMWRMALCGLGFGGFQVPNNRTLLGSAPRDRAGSAGGIQASARLLGQTAGATLVAIAFRAMGNSEPKILLIAAGVAFLGAWFSWMKPKALS